jgi:molybdopterin-guanine dinucleotide biosynthesis protein A
MTKLAGFCSDEFHAIVPVQPDAKPQPLCGFYRRESCLSVVEVMIKNSGLKMQRLLSG